jgi:predicted MFS family arabinose efflux permease
VLVSLIQGFRFIFSHGAISFVMIAMACGMFAMRSFAALLSIYTRDILLRSAETFGVLNSMCGIGMIGGSQLVRKFAVRSTPQHMVVYGMAGMGVSVLITAIFGRVETTALGMFGLGFFAAFLMITSQTLMQQETPPEMLGRVMSAMMSSLAFAQVLAMLGAGPVAQTTGMRNLFFGSAAILVTIGGIGLWKLRAPE